MHGEIAKALARRMGADEDDLAAHVLAGAVNAAVWSVVNHWVAAGAAPDRLLPTVDEAFAVLGVTPRRRPHRPGRRVRGRVATRRCETAA